MYGTDDKKVRMSFSSMQTGISAVNWLDNISGDFLVAAPKTGAVKIFNAANQNHKEIVKVSKHGILSILPTNKKNCFLMQLSSG